jgi:hypothetical protein
MEAVLSEVKRFRNDPSVSGFALFAFVCIGEFFAHFDRNPNLLGEFGAVSHGHHEPVLRAGFARHSTRLVVGLFFPGPFGLGDCPFLGLFFASTRGLPLARAHAVTEVVSHF